MTTKNVIILGVAAVVLGGAAYLTSSGTKVRTPSLNGKSVVKAFNVADVARVELGDKLVLVAGEQGWTVETLYGYPADVVKIRENVLKLAELKVGQVARGRKIDSPVKLALKDAKGKELAQLEIGDQHFAKPRGGMPMYGGAYPDGRYVKYADQTVLVKDALDAFDGDWKKWVNTRIFQLPSDGAVEVKFVSGKEAVELKRDGKDWTMSGLGVKEELDTSKVHAVDSALSYLDMVNVADPKLTEAELGFATGAVYSVAFKDGKKYVAKLGNTTNEGRYLKLEASFTPVGTNAVENAAIESAVKAFNSMSGKWTYVIQSYAADSMAKTRKDFVKAKEEPKPASGKADAAAGK